jgi:hypothetical protein
VHGVDGVKRIEARFYRTAAGNEPVRDWLRGLDKDDKRTIGEDVSTVEFGWPVGMPVCRSVGKLWEVRSSIKGGKVEARIYWGLDGGSMILLHGHEGKDDQRHEIAVAEGRWTEHRQRKAEAAKVARTAKRDK